VTPEPEGATRSGFGHGGLLFGAGALSGALITLSCVACLVLLLTIPLLSIPSAPDVSDSIPDAYVDLRLGDDGCHVVRSEVTGSTPVTSLTWVMRDMDGYTLLERNAEGEYDTKYFRGGQYRVYVTAWYSGRYHQISDEIVVDCPQGP
jgi:hypothetical protein